MGLFDYFHHLIVGRLCNVPGPPKGKVPYFRCTEEVLLKSVDQGNFQKMISMIEKNFCGRCIFWKCIPGVVFGRQKFWLGCFRLRVAGISKFWGRKWPFFRIFQTAVSGQPKASLPWNLGSGHVSTWNLLGWCKKMRFWKFLFIKYRSVSDIYVPPKVTLPPRDRTIFLHPSNCLGIGKDISKNWRLYIFCLGEKWKNVFFCLLKSVYEVKILENSKIP